MSRSGDRARRLRAIGAASLAFLFAAGCGISDEPPPLPNPVLGGEGVTHIHGLGVNPSDDSLVIATHEGLFRAGPGERRAEPVGDSRQDTMGFTVVGPNRFLGSGHPDVREDLPPLLGLIRSNDAGRSWTPVSLLGEADFHVLRAAENRVYGVNATDGALLVSVDRGASWQELGPPAPVLDLVPEPGHPDRVAAATERGVFLSSSGGRTWRPASDDHVGLLAWAARDALYLVDASGAVQRSPDGGRSWTAVGQIGGRPAAFASHGDELYVALHTNEVRMSTDGGRTWRWTRHLENTPGERFDYPSVVQGRDGLLHATYSYNLKTIKHVTFNEAWVKERR
jgi:hypothetical protein